MYNIVLCNVLHLHRRHYEITTQIIKLIIKIERNEADKTICQSLGF